MRVAPVCTIGLVVLAGCQTFFPASPPSADEVQAAWRQVFASCHRTGLQFEHYNRVGNAYTSLIEFAQEPLCKTHLETALQRAASSLASATRCNLEDRPANILAVSCSTSTGGLWDTYRHPQPGDKNALATSCALWTEKGVSPRISPSTRSLVLQNTPVCLDVVRRAFREDWEGLVQHRCAFTTEETEGTIQIDCTQGKGLPEELSALLVPKANGAKQNPEEAVGAAREKVYAACHRSGIQFEMYNRVGKTHAAVIELAKDPSCEASLDELNQRLSALRKGAYCQKRSNPEDSHLSVSCSTPYPDLFGKYRNPQKGNEKMMASACALATEQGESGTLSRNATRTVILENAPVCLAAVRQAFQEDWEGLVKNRCGFVKSEGSENTIEIECTDGKGLPAEFSMLVAPKTKVPVSENPNEQLVHVAWEKVYATCHRSGVHFETHKPGNTFVSLIEFAKEPACQESLQHAIERSKALWIGPRCTLEDKPASSSLAVSCTSLSPEIFSRYVHPYPGDKKALSAACELRVEEAKNGALLDPVSDTELTLHTTQVCLAAVQRAFREDWEGLVKNRCAFRIEEGDGALAIYCTEGKTLPQELLDLTTLESKTQAYLNILAKACPEVEILSARTLRFSRNNTEHCANVSFRALGEILRKQDHPEDPICSPRIDTYYSSLYAEGPTYFCNPGIPPEFVQHYAKLTPTKPISVPKTFSLETCRLAGGISKKKIHFFREDACFKELIHQLDDLPELQRNKCVLSAPRTFLEVECENGVPEEFRANRSKESINNAYQAGILAACQRVGSLTTTNIWFKNQSACFDRLEEPLTNNWSVFVKAGCETVTNDNGISELKLSCAKGLPEFIKAAYNGPSTP